MSIVIALIVVLVVGGLITKFYPKPKSTQVEEQPTWDFSPKPIPESTHVNPPVPETLTPKETIIESTPEVVVETPTMVAKPKKKPQPKKKSLKAKTNA